MALPDLEHEGIESTEHEGQSNSADSVKVDPSDQFVKYMDKITESMVRNLKEFKQKLNRSKIL